MPYTNLSLMTDAFGLEELVALTDRDRLFGNVIQSVLDRAIATADAEIDGYLATRYALPLFSVPDLLSGLSADMARYNLYTESPPDIVKDRYANAVRVLSAIASGKITLGLTSVEASDSARLVEIVSGRKSSPFGGFGGI